MTQNKKDLLQKVKKLALKGHPTRGKEVIELLKMMGGKNIHNLSGNNSYAYYVIEGWQNVIRAGEYIFGDEDMYFFTLEDFLEKYPFKVGDKVLYTKFGDNCDDYPVTIESMEWTGTTIEYTFDGCVTCLAKDLKMWNSNDICLKIEKNTNMNIEFDLTKYYYEVKNGKLVIGEKKPVYPKNYKKCCQIVGGIAFERHLQYDTIPSYKFEEDLRDSLETLRKLIICRNAYWKIAGEQMGLDKPCEPDWSDEIETYYTISYDGVNIKCYNDTDVYSKLAFPSAKIRDAFYENFKELIEQCKELL